MTGKKDVVAPAAKLCTIWLSLVTRKPGKLGEKTRVAIFRQKHAKKACFNFWSGHLGDTQAGDDPIV